MTRILLTQSTQHAALQCLQSHAISDFFFLFEVELQLTVIFIFS